MISCNIPEVDKWFVTQFMIKSRFWDNVPNTLSSYAPKFNFYSTHLNWTGHFERLVSSRSITLKKGQLKNCSLWNCSLWKPCTLNNESLRSRINSKNLTLRYRSSKLTTSKIGHFENFVCRFFINLWFSCIENKIESLWLFVFEAWDPKTLVYKIVPFSRSK